MAIDHNRFGHDFQIRQPTVLLLEGADEVVVLREVLTVMGLSDVALIDMNGKDKWGRSLATIVEDGEFRAHATALGLISDSDSDPGGRSHSLRDALMRSGWPDPVDAGSLVSREGCRGGFLLLPGGGSTGALEELVLQTVEPVRVEHARAYLEALKNDSIEGPRTHGKGVLRSVLAATRESPTDLYVAIQQGVFDLQHVALTELRAFLTSLCTTA